MSERTKLYFFLTSMVFIVMITASTSVYSTPNVLTEQPKPKFEEKEYLQQLVDFSFSAPSLLIQTMTFCFMGSLEKEQVMTHTLFKII